MNQAQPITAYDAINLLANIQPLAAQINEKGPTYQFDQATQLYLSHLVEKINQADFSAQALSQIHQSAGLSAPEMKALFNWYSYHRAQVEPATPDGVIEMEAWLQD